MILKRIGTTAPAIREFLDVIYKMGVDVMFLDDFIGRDIICGYSILNYIVWYRELPAQGLRHYRSMKI